MPSDSPRIVLIGAGSAQFGYGTLGDIFQSRVLRARKAQIVLHDINPATLSEVFKTGQAFIKQNQLPFVLTATTSRQEALRDADFCIISIEIGNRFELWEQDWRVPQQFGFRQVYGENGGPGGFFHSLRIIPPILEICRDITQLCPQAYIFNFSNPMSRICTAVHLAFPKLRFIGLCHEIASLAEHLPNILDTPYDQLEITAGGLNHFSCLLEARHKKDGRDVYPEILAGAAAYFETWESWTAEVLKEHGGRALKPACWHERGLFRLLLDKYRLLPITTDSHFGEYLSWAYDAVDHEGILDFYEAYKLHVTHSRPQIDTEIHERVIPIIDGILSNAAFEEQAVNLPNDGLIEQLPSFIAVEVPAKIDANGIHGRSIGDKIPAGFAAMLQNQVAIHRMTAETVLTRSRAVALQALLADPIVDKADAAEKMLDYMLGLQEKYLGYLT